MSPAGASPPLDGSDETDLAREFDELASMHDAVARDAARYASLFELAPTPLVVTDTNLTILEANDAAVQLFDVELRFLLGKPLSVYVDLPDRRTFRSPTFLRDSRAHVASLRMRRRTGVSFDVELTVRRERTEIHWAFRDRSEEAQTEQRLWELNAELERRVREQSAELDALVDQLPVGVAVLRADGTLAWRNARGREILGSQMPDLSQHLPFEEVLGGEIVRDRRIVTTRPDGSDLVLSLTAAPITSDAGGAVVLVQDITVRDRIERADAEFVQNAAHQLRNPITAIATSIAAIDAGAGEDEIERRRFLHHVRRESGRLTTLVDALLTLASLARGAASPVVEVVSLREILAQAAEAAAPTPVDIDCPQHLAVVGDRELFAQAIGNVLANAAEHCERSVEVNARVEDGTAVVDVRDDGPGVPSEARDRVFERFFRAPGGRSGGSGLGLAIAQAAARANKSSLELLPSVEGEGATFRFAIPGARLL